MNTQSAVPTIPEELERKSFETIDWLFSAVENGKITKQQFKTGIDALFLATGGLVSNDIFALITQANDVIKSIENIQSRHFIVGSEVLTLRWKVDTETVKVLFRKDGKLVRGSDRHFDSAKDAYFWFSMHGDSLSKKAIEL